MGSATASRAMVLQRAVRQSLQHDDAAERTPDHARCTCRAFLEFSTGRFGESIERCPAGCFGWRAIRPLYATRPSPSLEVQRGRMVAGRGPKRQPDAFAPEVLTAVLAEIPPAPAAVSRQDLLDRVPLSTAWVDRVLRHLRQRQQVRAVRVRQQLTLSRVQP